MTCELGVFERCVTRDFVTLHIGVALAVCSKVISFLVRALPEDTFRTHPRGRSKSRVGRSSIDRVGRSMAEVMIKVEFDRAKPRGGVVLQCKAEC